VARRSSATLSLMGACVSLEVKLWWIVAAHLRKNRAIRSYLGRPHLGIGNTGVADESLIAHALNGFAIIWGD